MNERDPGAPKNTKKDIPGAAIRDGLRESPQLQSAQLKAGFEAFLKGFTGRIRAAAYELANKQRQRDWQRRMKTAYDLFFCQHYYNATKGNPLFALEAYQIYRDLGIPVKHSDWFMEYISSLSDNMMAIKLEGHDGERANQAVYRGFLSNNVQKGRSVFTEYHKIKERTKIYLQIKELLKKGKGRAIAFSQISEQTELSPKRLEDIYRDEDRIFNLGISAFIENKLPRKV